MEQEAQKETRKEAEEEKGSPEIGRDGGEKDRSLQASPTLEVSEEEEEEVEELKEKGEKSKGEQPKIVELKRKTAAIKKKVREAKFDWNEGKYV